MLPMTFSPARADWFAEPELGPRFLQDSGALTRTTLTSERPKVKENPAWKVTGQSRRAERGHSCPQQLPNYGAPFICWRSCVLHIAADRNVRAPPRFH